MNRQDDLEAKYKTPISEDCYINGKLLDGTNGKILHDIAASKSFMSTTFLNWGSLHSLSKFVSKTKNIVVGNGQYIGVLLP